MKRLGLCLCWSGLFCLLGGAGRAAAGLPLLRGALRRLLCLKQRELDGDEVLTRSVASGLGGVRQLFWWGENWVRASFVLMALQGEFVNWSCGSAPYDGADSLAVLASRTEELVRSEAGEWAQTRSSVPQAPVAGPPASGG